jgi:hypothetical protein
MRRKLQLSISNHNYQQTAISKQTVGSTVMKYAIEVTISCNKKNIPVRTNDISTYVCMYVCTYGCMYVCMYVSK